VISPREATLRTLAVAALCGVAIVQLLALPYALVQGPQVAAVPGAAIAGALWLARALATTGPSGGRAAWRGTIVLGVLASGGWLVTRAVAVPGVPEDAGHWTSPVGLAAVALGVALAGLALAAIGFRGGLRAVAGTLAVALAVAPVAAIPLASLGPAPAHVHGLTSTPTLTAGAVRHHTGHAAPAGGAPASRIRPGFGGHSGHYVYANVTRPHLPPWALALALGLVAAAVSSAAGALRRRAGLDPPGGMRALTRSRRPALYR
jgi:hypothetical protein